MNERRLFGRTVRSNDDYVFAGVAIAIAGTRLLEELQIRCILGIAIASKISFRVLFLLFLEKVVIPPVPHKIDFLQTV